MEEKQKEERVRVSKEFLEEILEKIRVRRVKFREYSTAGKLATSEVIIAERVAGESKLFSKRCRYYRDGNYIYPHVYVGA